MCEQIYGLKIKTRSMNPHRSVWRTCSCILVLTHCFPIAILVTKFSWNNPSAISKPFCIHSLNLHESINFQLMHDQHCTWPLTSSQLLMHLTITTVLPMCWVAVICGLIVSGKTTIIRIPFLLIPSKSLHVVFTHLACVLFPYFNQMEGVVGGRGMHTKN